jgi:hypothetical protein
MTYQFARIDLSKTNYTTAVKWDYITDFDVAMLAKLDDIYRTYTIHKRFASVMPMFHSRYTDPMTDVIGYYDQDQLVAFSLIRRYDEHNALCDQFAWNYRNPKLRLGIETMKTECAIYLARGFKYLYLEQAHLYKQEMNGFEILGPLE